MSEREMWIQAYIANMASGTSHHDSMKNADEVIQRISALNT